MAAPEPSDYELLTEHFGYPPVSLLDDIINTVNVLADRALDSVERLLLSIPPQNLGFRPSKDPDAPSLEEAARLEIENGTHQLETLLNASIDKNFDLFELYAMNNILKVRPDHLPHVRLAHYDGLDFSAVSSSSSQQQQQQQHADRPTPESVTALRRRLHASQRLHAALETERARNDALLAKLRAALGAPAAPSAVKAEESPPAAAGSPFGFLRDLSGIEHAGSDMPIATTAEFTLSQLQALRSLSTSLRTLLPDLGPADDDNSQGAASSAGAGRSWRRERVEYVEAASRKYLEKERGLELGDQGEVRDGEWQGGGRKMARNEVEALEGIAAMLGQGKPAQKTPRKAPASTEQQGEPMDES